MIDLKEVMTKYPESLESAARFRAYMADLYPERADQVRIKVLADVISCGVVDEIKAGNTDSLSISRYRKLMEDRYGYSSRLVAESIAKWVQAYAPSDAPAKQPEKAVPAPINFDIDKIHVHSFEDTKVPATCRERGYTLHRCRCGYEHRDGFTPRGAHQFEMVDEVMPTCTEEGRKELLCAMCSEYKSESIPKTDHIMGDWTIVQEAGCETVGRSERRCKTCANTETKQIPALGHNWGKWTEQIYSTCTEPGKQIHQCSRCGKNEEKVLPATGHKFSKWADSSTQEGMQERFCENCGLEEFRKAVLINPADFTIVNGVLEFYHGNGGDIGIPDSVTEIAFPAFCSHKNTLMSIMIPNSVTKIGNEAFRWCEKLTSVTIPNSVIEIGNGAFDGCSSLTSIIIPNGVTRIGRGAFSGCSSLTSVMIPCSVTEIGERAFYGCNSLTNITIPDSVTWIGNEAFGNCSSLVSIIVDQDNKTYDSRDNSNAIIESASNTLAVGCKNTVISSTVTEIGNRAFSGCSSLTSIMIPDSVTKIGNEAFNWCSSLTSITIPNGVTKIGNEAFRWCKKLTNITIPNSVTRICNYTFAWCSSLTSITIPSSVTQIGEGAFDGCSSLTSIIIPNSVTEIGDWAFKDCSSLTSITIPNSITKIAWSFRDCSGLTSVTILNSVTKIDSWAFEGCDKLTAIHAPRGSYAEEYAKKHIIPFSPL